METHSSSYAGCTSTFSYSVDLCGFDKLYVLAVLELELSKLLHNQKNIDAITQYLPIKSILLR